MTEHKKIPVPPENEKGTSLFERASGAFGFDTFTPAPLPGKLDEQPIKRTRIRKQKVEEPTHAKQGVPEREEATAQQMARLSTEPPLPVPVLPSDSVAEPVDYAVRFGGKRLPVDRELLRDQGLIVPEAAAGALIEEFRIVKRGVIGTATKLGTAASRRVLVCSPHPGEGKTFCATNLAIAIAAERDSEVLLVDADFAKPSILSTLGLPKGAGFMDCLANPQVQPEECVIGTDIPGLWVLPAGNQTNSASEYLASRRTAEVLDRVTAGAPNRVVVFDTPPALAASPAAELAKHVGQAILVARADTTGQSALEDAAELLSACPDIKLLLNGAHFSPSGRNFGSYYGYGE